MDLKAKDKATVTVLINDKPKRRRLRVGDPDFVPPDGGWGWLVVFGCGFSNLSTFPMFQQFGLIFEDKFKEIGISETQKTFITNLTSAFNAAVGLTNGPMYRKFTFRQVSCTCSLLVAASLFACVYCNSFLTYVLCFCVLYGSSFGFVQSANALALNTYFKEKRRIATGFSWTTTGLGPVFWPYIIYYLEKLLLLNDMEVLMVFSAFALNSFVCALLLQPVEWHTKFKDEVETEKLLSNDKEKLQPSQDTGRLSRISSLIFPNFGNEDDPLKTSYEIFDPGTPMMIRANDGWYSQSRSQVGSRLSLSSNKGLKPISGQNSGVVSTRPSYTNLSDYGKTKGMKSLSGQNSGVVSTRPSYTNLSDYGKTKDYRKKSRKVSVQEGRTIREVEERASEEKEPMINDNQLQVPNEKDVLKYAAKKLAEYEHDQQIKEQEEKMKQVTEEEDIKEEELSCWQKLIIFFDFGLLKDLVYVNIMVGITIANFAELNFSILTPIIMSEFNFPKSEIAAFMSLLGATDIIIRFSIPFIADKIGWSNRTFFLIGVMSMAIGRIILVHTQTYYIALLVAVIVGAGKALRTIFMALVIPTHVPIEKLPAASGLQLAFCGLSYIFMGPLVGWVRELVGSYVITLHILNICTYGTAISWIIEMLITKRRKRKQQRAKEWLNKKYKL